MNSNALCPCGSTLTYQNCCELIHKDQSLAESAEMLMRARYTAFVQDDEDFLKQSWAAATRPEEIDTGADSIHWLRLEILETGAGKKGDPHGTVEFVTTFLASGHLCRLHETSNFIFQDNCWYYLDGISESSREKIGRNDKCPCGSGKKFKKCCGP